MTYKKLKVRPVVGFYLFRNFSDIAIEFKAMEKVHILYILDHTTQFSMVTVVKSKKKEETVEAFIKNMIATFGAPHVILSDNGGEFNNQ